MEFRPVDTLLNFFPPLPLALIQELSGVFMATGRTAVTQQHQLLSGCRSPLTRATRGCKENNHSDLHDLEKKKISKYMLIKIWDKGDNVETCNIFKSLNFSGRILRDKNVESF